MRREGGAWLDGRAVVRAVLDPDVLIRAAISEGMPREVVLHWAQGKSQFVVSTHLLYELQAVLSRQQFGRYLPRALPVRDVDRRPGEGRSRPRLHRRAPHSGEPDDDHLTVLALDTEAEVKLSPTTRSPTCSQGFHPRTCGRPSILRGLIGRISYAPSCVEGAFSELRLPPILETSS